MARRKVRDIYGNWVYEEDNEDSKRESASSHRRNPVEKDEAIHLNLKDWIALIIASLETVLLPLIIFMAVVIVLAALFFHL